MFNLGRSKTSSNRLTSLNLEAPAASDQPRQEPGTKPQAPQAVPDPRIQAEINRGASALGKSGKHPEAIFYLVNAASRHPIFLATPQVSSRTVLLFSSSPTARFFMQEKNLSVEMAGVAFQQFAGLSEALHANGIDSFAMDANPKSPSMNVMKSADKLITSEQVTFAWALVRTIRNFQAQRILHPLFAAKDFGSAEGQKRLRQALEVVRISGGYEVPFVHWMIALIAGMQHDELGRLEASADLEAFGPDFVGRTLPIESYDDRADWFKQWTQAHLGLLTEFEMLLGPDGKPLESILRVANIPMGGSPDGPNA